MTTLKQTMDDLTNQGGPLDLGPDRTRLFIRVIRELARGRPVTSHRVSELIADLGLAPGEARDFLEQWTEQDDDGNVVGLTITLNETPHRYITDGASAFAWCALDTLVLPRVLNSTARVESRSPATDETVTLEVTPEGVKSGTPPGAVISAPVVELHEMDTSSVEAIWGTFCHRSFFFPSRDEAELWVGDKDKIAVASLDEGSESALDLAERILAYGS
jgi:alkylmercury lyase